MDRVFKALADPNRRKLLDLLRVDNGQVLGDLSKHLDMSRQAATKHLNCWRPPTWWLLSGAAARNSTT